MVPCFDTTQERILHLAYGKFKTGIYNEQPTQLEHTILSCPKVSKTSYWSQSEGLAHSAERRNVLCPFSHITTNLTGHMDDGTVGCMKIGSDLCKWLGTTENTMYFCTIHIFGTDAILKKPIILSPWWSIRHIVARTLVQSLVPHCKMVQPLWLTATQGPSLLHSILVTTLVVLSPGRWGRNWIGIPKAV